MKIARPLKSGSASFALKSGDKSPQSKVATLRVPFRDYPAVGFVRSGKSYSPNLSGICRDGCSPPCCFQSPRIPQPAGPGSIKTVPSISGAPVRAMTWSPLVALPSRRVDSNNRILFNRRQEGGSGNPGGQQEHPHTGPWDEGFWQEPGGGMQAQQGGRKGNPEGPGAIGQGGEA